MIDTSKLSDKEKYELFCQLANEMGMDWGDAECEGHGAGAQIVYTYRDDDGNCTLPSD